MPVVVNTQSNGSGRSRRRFWLAMLGLVLAISLAPFSYQVESRLETAVHIQGGEGEAVSSELEHRFQSPYTHRAVLVIEGLPDADTDGGREALDLVSQTFRAEPGVSAVLTQLDWSDQVFQGKNGGMLVLIGLKPQAGSEETRVPVLRARAVSLEQQLRQQYPNAKLELTGETPLNYDLRRVSSEDVSHAEKRVLPVTLILLVLAFGSLVAAVLPLGVALLAIAMTMGAAALLGTHFHLSILLQNLTTMLGLGLGIDYALLMVNRFREALAIGHAPGTAADIAAKQAGRTLMISASTVAIGFAVLLWVPISEIRSIGLAGLLVAAMSVALCTLVLPFILGLIGNRINAGSIRNRKWLSFFNRRNQPAMCAEDRWRIWGMKVTGRPWTALILAGAPLLLLAFQAQKIVIGLPSGNWLPARAEAVHALNTLKTMDRDGIVQSLRVVLELPAATPPTSAAGWKAVSQLTRRLQQDKRAAEVISLPMLTAMADQSSAIDSVDESVRQGFLRDDGRATLLEVLPATGVSPADQVAWVRQLRAANVAEMTGMPGAVIRIGGIPALNADYDVVVGEYMPRVMAAVVVGSLLALLIGLRSLVVALKAVLLNLLSVGAAFGALVLVFQEGHGIWLFGLHAGVEKIFPMIPIISFAIVFGLSMDYEVFLVARVLEERRSGLTERAAVAQGLACTAGLITSAAAIMIAVFAAFTLGDFLVIKMVGFTLAIAVLIDATIVRMIIGPALLQLAGDWNWWPLGLTGSKPLSELESTQ